MLTELFISWRYLMTKRKEKFISLISIISVLGVAIGVMALIVVIAVMAGFDNDLRDKIVGNYSHLTIAGYKTIEDNEYNAILEKISSNPHIQGSSPYIQGQVLVKEEKRFFAVSLKGIDPASEPRVTKIKKYLTQGNLEQLGNNAVIIGRELALYLGVSLGRRLLLIRLLARSGI